MEIVFSTQDGSIHYIDNGKYQWSRDESLADISTSVVIERPPEENLDLQEALDHTDQSLASLFSHYLKRWARHLGAISTRLINFTEYLSNPFKQSSSILNNHGYSKVFIAASHTGKIVALDTLTGSTLWTRYFPKMEFRQLFVLREASNHLNSIVAILGFIGDSTEICLINGMTGESVLIDGFISHHFNYRILQASLIEYSNVGIRSIALIHPFMEVSIFPKSSHIPSKSNSYFYLSMAPGGNNVCGFIIGKKLDSGVIISFNTAFLYPPCMDFQAARH